MLLSYSLMLFSNRYTFKNVSPAASLSASFDFYSYGDIRA